MKKLASNFLNDLKTHTIIKRQGYWIVLDYSLEEIIGDNGEEFIWYKNNIKELEQEFLLEYQDCYRYTDLIGLAIDLDYDTRYTNSCANEYIDVMILSEKPIKYKSLNQLRGIVAKTNKYLKLNLFNIGLFRAQLNDFQVQFKSDEYQAYIFNQFNRRDKNIYQSFVIRNNINMSVTVFRFESENENFAVVYSLNPISYHTKQRIHSYQDLHCIFKELKWKFYSTRYVPFPWIKHEILTAQRPFKGVKRYH